MTKQIDLVIDLQFGSTGKGALAGYLAETKAPDTVMCAFAPNAGHTYINAAGEKFIHMMIPNGVVSKNLKRVMIGPGALIDPDTMLRELDNVNKYLGDAAIVIHPNAAVVLERHREEEAGPMTKIGSTKKGVGAAMIERIRRDPDSNNVASRALLGNPLHQYVVSESLYNRMLGNANSVLVEGAQGFSLSMYHGFYPYCTSRDVTPHQILADCGIPYGLPVNVIGTMRTYPIRVANRYSDGDGKGQMIGYSGPGYSDQEEIEWSDIGIDPEVTTVTKLRRRVFNFSWEQALHSISVCRPNEIFLNFANYLADFEAFKQMVTGIDHLCNRHGGNGVRYVGVGPTVKDMILLKNSKGIEDNIGIDEMIEYYAERG
jgi:adenylosuccinate synthase